MPRVAIHTIKEAADLSHNAVEEVILSRDLWDLILGQLVPEEEEEDQHSTSSSSSSSIIRDHKGDPSRIAIAISRRYRLEGVPTRRKSNSPISSIVCWACLDSFSSNTSEQKSNDKSRSLSNSKASTVSYFTIKFPILKSVLFWELHTDRACFRPFAGMSYKVNYFISPHKSTTTQEVSRYIRSLKCDTRYKTNSTHPIISSLPTSSQLYIL